MINHRPATPRDDGVLGHPQGVELATVLDRKHGDVQVERRVRLAQPEAPQDLPPDEREPVPDGLKHQPQYSTTGTQ